MKRLDPETILWPPHYVTEDDGDRPWLTGEDWNDLVREIKILQAAVAPATPDDTITLSQEEYDNLREDSLFLSALREAGVDNWEWYGEAVVRFNEMLEE
jgi:hypothetical protein